MTTSRLTAALTDGQTTENENAESLSATRQRLLGLLPAAALAAILLVGLISYFASATFESSIDRGWTAMRSGDGPQITAYVSSFGVWGPFISMTLMVVQAIAAPFPSTLIVFANGLAYGTFWGGIVSLIGQVLAAAACFWIARSLGRTGVETMLGRIGLASADKWFEKWGSIGIFISRVVPGVPADMLAYAAGLTNLSFRQFAIATAAGACPQVFLYAYLIQSAPILAWVSFGITIALVCGGVIFAWINRRSTSRLASTCQ